MIAKLFESSSLPVLQEVMNFTQTRHGILAGNIANVHTPGYQGRDLSVDNFQAALKKSIEAKQLPQIHSPGFAGRTPLDEAAKELKAASNNLLYHDGTNLDIEQQVVAISKNQFMHNMAVSIMNNQFQLLSTAISERV